MNMEFFISRRRFPGMFSRAVQPPKKKSKMTGYVPAKTFTVKETWTHDFCVLSKLSASATPSRSVMNQLLDAGLGRARLTMPKTAGHAELTQILEERFPKLKSGGGFEILRADGGGAGQRHLCVVAPGAFGYAAPHLKTD